MERCIEKFQVEEVTQHRVMLLFCELLFARSSKQLEQSKHRLEEDREVLVFDPEHLLGRLCSLNWDGDLTTTIAWFKDVKFSTKDIEDISALFFVQQCLRLRENKRTFWGCSVIVLTICFSPSRLPASHATITGFSRETGRRDGRHARDGGSGEYDGLLLGAGGEVVQPSHFPRNLSYSFMMPKPWRITGYIRQKEKLP